MLACTTEINNAIKNLCSTTKDFQVGFHDKSRQILGCYSHGLKNSCVNLQVSQNLKECLFNYLDAK